MFPPESECDAGSKGEWGRPLHRGPLKLLRPAALLPPLLLLLLLLVVVVLLLLLPPPVCCCCLTSEALGLRLRSSRRCGLRAWKSGWR